MKIKILLQLISMSKYALYGIFLQAFFCSIIIAKDGNAQAKHLDEYFVSMEMENSQLLDILKAIEKQTGFHFSFNKKILNEPKTITVSFKNRPLSKVLMQISKETGYRFRRVDKNIHIKNEGPPVSEYSKQSIAVDIAVSGRVTDLNGEGIPGVNVIIKGTAKGTVTNVNGNYNIVVSSSESILVFSSIGFISEEITVGDQSVINISLVPDITALDEVVVIGYGAVKKEDLTGAVGSVGSDVITSTALPDAAGALQGRVAGVNIEKNVGRPGSGFEITVRGLSSINNSNDPLYVIDGIPTTSGLIDLNPVDIAKIDILKDASATAIYGSRGANGVVIVTTKRGKKGKFTIQYDGYVGVRTPSNLPDMMNGEEYVRWRTDLFTNQGKSTDRSNPEFFTPEEWDIIDRGAYTDWIDLILRNGMQTSNTITASGGDENGTFALSIGQLKEEGTVPGQDYNRYNLRLNLSRKFAKRWEAGGNLYFTHSVQNEGSYETLRSAYRLPPVANPYDENGDPRYFTYRNDFVTNPLFEYKDDGELRENRRYRAFGNVYLQFEPIEGLTLRSQLAPQMTYTRNGQYFGQYSKSGSGKKENIIASYSTSDYFGYVLDNQLMYQKDIAKHDFSLTFIQSLQYDQWEDSYQSASNPPYNSKWYNLDAVTKDDILASETNYSQSTLSSFLGRLQYTYNDKYLFTATGRYDGSSRLAEGNKWTFFPSAAIGWRLSEESFMQNIDKISNLKLRVSYGVTGNDAVDIYGTQSNLAQWKYDFGGVVSPSYYKNRLANTDLTWEKTTEINIGLDYGFFNYRINGAIDVYKRDAKDLIMQRQLPQTSGWESIWDNVGWVRNTGIEIGLNTLNIQADNFSWTSHIVFDRNKNEIMELYGEEIDDVGNGWFIGHPIRVNYDYEFDGIWQSDEAELAAEYGQTPGQVKVKDLSKDKVIDSDDRKIIGQRTPKWSGSITNTLNYKNWDFSIFIYTRQGQQLFSTFKSTFMSLEGNFKNVAVDYWTESNPSNEYPQPGNKGEYFNSFRYSDVSFVRIGNISLGYTIPEKALNRLNISKLRIYVTATNPFTFTSYEGFDPEWADQNTWGEATGYSTYLLGINLQL